MILHNKVSPVPSTEEILRRHGAYYPKMAVCDAVKLLYQSAFGPGHALADEDTVLTRINREIASLPPKSDCTFPLVAEDIGSYARLMLTNDPASPWVSHLVARLFIHSAKSVSPSQEEFLRSLDTLRRLCSEGVFAFDMEALESYLSAYIKAGMPAVSHSEAYRQAYAPAYRLMKRDYAPLLPLLLTIEKHLQEDRSLYLLIDGLCGSGKSTLAALLADLFPARTVHVDDFFLPPQKRTADRLAEPGGNVDYERIRAQVAEHLTDDSLSYDVFDCSVMAHTHRRTLPYAPLTIIEGSYACHPAFGIPREANVLRIYVECEADVQEGRLLDRNGKSLLERFINEWIPMEREYNKAFHIRDNCDFIIKT